MFKITSRHGISMAETIISTMLIGFVLVSTLQIVGPMVQSTSLHTDRLLAANLANELTEEISTKFWTSPVLNDPESMGPGATETRATYDDVDDYHGWSASPPKMSTDQANIYLGGWTRSVTVEHVLVSNPLLTSGSSTGLKRVVVTVSKNGVTHATVISLHSASADTLGFIVISGGG